MPRGDWVYNMTMIDKSKWLEKQELLLRGDKANNIQPKRSYLHFDHRIKRITPKIASQIFSPSAITAYSFYPFLRYQTKIRKRKKNGKGIRIKTRNISFAAHLDSLIFSWYAQILYERYEKIIHLLGIDACVLAYRSGNGSNVDHACKAFRDIQGLDEACVLCVDIKNFFDTLNHSILKKNWLTVLNVENENLTQLPDDHYAVYKAITKYSFVDSVRILKLLGLKKNDSKYKKMGRLCSPDVFRNLVAKSGLITRNEKIKQTGIPQGSSISALLANIYMLDFDSAVEKK